MKVVAYTAESVFAVLKPEWNQLLSQSRANRLFLTWQWQWAWWSVYHPGELWVLVVRDEVGALVGLAPWFIEYRERTGRTVRSVGCVDVTDYLEIIVHQAHEEAVLQALGDYLIAHESTYDTIDLCNIPADSPVLEYFRPVLEAKGLLVTIKPQEVCPVIDLPASFEDYLKGLDKKDRHELKRKLRRVEKGDNKTHWYMVGPEHDLSTELENFLALMRMASPDKDQFLQNDAHLTFFRRVVPMIAEAGWLQLAFLCINDEYAAAYLNFDYDQEILVYNSGLNLGVAAQLSAGIVLLTYLIKDAIDRGYKRFDFLRGNEEYKYRLGGRDTQLYMLIATKPQPAIVQEGGV